jgi:hypothetical protein
MKKIFFYNFKTLYFTIFFFLLFIIVLSIRGYGWDGDSLVNIAQFKKIIYFSLFGIPDMGTTPKLLPILLFGGYNYFFDSYTIHLPVIIIFSYSLAKVVQLSKRSGGGFIWLFLPFISPALIFNIVSADNPALAIAFYILSISYFFNKKIFISFIFLLLAEFSRPGYSLLMFLTLTFLFFNQTLILKINKIKIFLILVLCFLGLIHSLFCYKLGYLNFDDYNINNWDVTITDGESEFLENRLTLVKAYFAGFLAAVLSHNLFPFPIAIILIFIFLYSFKELKNNLTILFLQPIIYFPLLFSGIILGKISAIENRNIFFFENIYSLSPHLFTTFIPVLLFSLALFFNRIANNFSKIEENKFKINIFNIIIISLKKVLTFVSSLKVSLVLSIILALINGYILKDIYEYNPVNPKNETKWISNSTSNEIIIELYNKKQRKLNVLATCDLIPILIDKSKFIRKLSVASDKTFMNSKSEYLNLCNNERIVKRPDDVVLNKSKKFDITKNFDILYTTKNMLNFFETSNHISIIHLEYDRILLVNHKK